jgi:hypothetical protein
MRTVIRASVIPSQHVPRTPVFRDLVAPDPVSTLEAGVEGSPDEQPDEPQALPERTPDKLRMTFKRGSDT